MDNSQSPVLNPGLEPNAIVSPDNLHTEPAPKFINNDVEVPVVEEVVEDAAPAEEVVKK